MTPTISELLPPFITIPAGPFLMGTPEAELSELAKLYGGTRESYREEAPQHEVQLAAFAIAAVPVTNALFGAYVAATGAPPPLVWRGPNPPADRLDHPVVDINWQEAIHFCDWLSPRLKVEGGGLELQRSAEPSASNMMLPEDVILHSSSFILPTEAEWERAARGTDGRRFPWGDAFRPELANTRESGRAGTTPVGAYPAGASPCGALDMAGNVWEWTSSLDMLYPYNTADGREGEGPGRRIMRGGCYANPHGYARCACRFRLPPAVRNEFTGFRLAVRL